MNFVLNKGWVDKSETILRYDEIVAKAIDDEEEVELHEDKIQL